MEVSPAQMSSHRRCLAMSSIELATTSLRS